MGREPVAWPHLSRLDRLTPTPAATRLQNCISAHNSHIGMNSTKNLLISELRQQEWIFIPGGRVSAFRTSGSSHFGNVGLGQHHVTHTCPRKECFDTGTGKAFCHRSSYSLLNETRSCRRETGASLEYTNIYPNAEPGRHHRDQHAPGSRYHGVENRTIEENKLSTRIESNIESNDKLQDGGHQKL
ncbi:hypothetical protein P175DRAFT_0533004 [Aspergillus ochraceoroseus IBT 24754]|uniref:Uncharacterized protein n=1 Tax=Aspergillus ochraceoroseus IBT 24754 TaxID=1392256 RepID=A0A2T5LUS5_9EURO|nr:uncharacterized protein P175DRAFT_0533004 [Aspergillus ochraceoroseus IBT 24754]PTU20034.1 hypothetical protein P175DRAFT_0533004 [Aspergillus ochraceoroseus IBT 24754]